MGALRQAMSTAAELPERLLLVAKGRRRAVVAVARKTAAVLHRMWVDGADFRFGSEAVA